MLCLARNSAAFSAMASSTGIVVSFGELRKQHMPVLIGQFHSACPNRMNKNFDQCNEGGNNLELFTFDGFKERPDFGNVGWVFLNEVDQRTCIESDR